MLENNFSFEWKRNFVIGASARFHLCIFWKWKSNKKGWPGYQLHKYLIKKNFLNIFYLNISVCRNKDRVESKILFYQFSQIKNKSEVFLVMISLFFMLKNKMKDRFHKNLKSNQIISIIKYWRDCSRLCFL